MDVTGDESQNPAAPRYAATARAIAEAFVSRFAVTNRVTRKDVGRSASHLRPGVQGDAQIQCGRLEQ